MHVRIVPNPTILAPFAPLALAAALALTPAGPALADEDGASDVHTPSWNVSGEVGLVLARGNSETETYNFAVQSEYLRGRWTNTTKVSFLHSEDRDNITANRFVLENNLDYNINERSYVTGSLRYDRDRFSSFRYQSTIAAGLGYRLIATERHRLKVEAGPGYRFAEIRETGDREEELILRGLTEYRWQISETARFTNRALVETGDDNTFFENNADITVAINSALSLRTGFQVRRNSSVEGDDQKTDYLTRINLVYSF